MTETEGGNRRRKKTGTGEPKEAGKKPRKKILGHVLVFRNMFFPLRWLRNEMPGDPKEQCAWVLNKVAGDLQDCKMWPVRLGGLKRLARIKGL